MIYVLFQGNGILFKIIKGLWDTRYLLLGPHKYGLNESLITVKHVLLFAEYLLEPCTAFKGLRSLRGVVLKLLALPC